MASDTADKTASLSGLTQAEAQEFHKGFIGNFILFTGIALVAHLLVWIWRPWIPGEAGWDQALLQDGVQIANTVMPFLS
ncbi:MAG: light-harvesting antenna LH1, beta subunit [Pseudomonadota bacterium]